MQAHSLREDLQQGKSSSRLSGNQQSFNKAFLGRCRALKAGEKEPILKPYILSDEVDKLAEDKQQPEIKDSGFARLLKVPCALLGICKQNMALKKK